MNGRPSDLMSIEDDYLAFCFDEACAFIITEMEKGKKPIPRKDKGKSKQEKKSYSRPSDVYKKFSVK